MVRYTYKDAEKCAKYLADEIGIKKFGECWSKSSGWGVGCWQVDCNPYYGGCVIEEITNDSGGTSSPLGSTRLPPRDFCTATRMAMSAVAYYKKYVERR